MFARANSSCPLRCTLFDTARSFAHSAAASCWCLAASAQAVAVAVDGSTMQPNAAHVAISTAEPRILVSAQSAEYACDLTKERESLDLAEIDRGAPFL